MTENKTEADVVWEWKGTRVKEDGSLEFWLDGWSPARDGWVSTGAAKAMAKALAESIQASRQTAP